MANLPDPGHQPDLRVSNAEREQVVAQLQQASADGRLDLDELDGRLQAAYAAKTYSDLASLTTDLPGADAPDRSATGTSAKLANGPRPTSRWGVALFGGFTRRGAWVVPRLFTAITIFGGGTIDLRNARFTDSDTKIRILSIMGGVEVILSPETQVHVTGMAVMGGWDQPAEGPPTPEGPRVTVSGLAIMGGVGVKRRERHKK